METFIINVPEKKASLVKQLLKELGVDVQSQNPASLLANDINAAIKPGQVPNMQEIVDEVNTLRAGK